MQAQNAKAEVKRAPDNFEDDDDDLGDIEEGGKSNMRGQYMTQ